MKDNNDDDTNINQKNYELVFEIKRNFLIAK